MNMATSTSPEEAGQHVAEMFGQNGQGEPDGDEGAQPAPAAQPQSAAPPEE